MFPSPSRANFFVSPCQPDQAGKPCSGLHGKRLVGFFAIPNVGGGQWCWMLAESQISSVRLNLSSAIICMAIVLTNQGDSLVFVQSLHEHLQS